MSRVLRTLASTSALCAAASFAGAQTISTVAVETFDSYTPGSVLGGQVGGLFWFQAWWSGAGGTDGMIVNGLNGTSAAMTVGCNHCGSFRLPLTGPWLDTIASDFKFGDDGSTMWIRFWSQRNGEDMYGGLSLNEQFVGERGFLGSPWQSGEWGFASGAGTFTTTGANIDMPTYLVYKLTFQAGDEQVDMWVNPASDNPTTTPDVTGMLTDVSPTGAEGWNEIRLQSGGDNLDNHGWFFDEIHIECQDCAPKDLAGDTTSISVGGGGTQTLQLSAGPANALDNYLLLGSATGTAGIPTDAGLLPLTLDAYTLFTLKKPNSAILGNSFNTLDIDGKNQATFNIPSGADPSLAGFQINHAYVVIAFNPLPEVTYVSTAEPCDLVP